MARTDFETAAESLMPLTNQRPSTTIIPANRIRTRKGRARHGDAIEAKDWCRWHHPRVPIIEIGRDRPRRMVRGSMGRPKKAE